MQYTNKYNLPEWLVSKLVREPKPPNPERMSATDLIHPPRMRTLFMERWEDVETDVSDCFNMWFGNLLDGAFEDDEDSQTKMELKIDGITLVGKMDNLIKESGGIIIPDYKFTKVGQTSYKQTMREWECQLNIYDYMYDILEFLQVLGLENHLFYRDWSATKVGRENNYPKIAYEVVKQPQWTHEEQQQYILDQLMYHRKMPYDCPEEDRWGSFAVRTKGKQRADRVLSTRQECEDWMNEKGRGDYIESRAGRRCEHYCKCNSVCKYSSKCIDKYKGEK